MKTTTIFKRARTGKGTGSWEYPPFKGRSATFKGRVLPLAGLQCGARPFKYGLHMRGR